MNNGSSIGSYPLVFQFLKGIFQTRTPIPKYNYIWEVSTVLNYLATLHPVEQLSLKNLTLKLVMSLLLVTGKREHVIHQLSLDGMRLMQCFCELQILYRTKTSRPCQITSPIHITQYLPNEKICPLTTLRAHLERTRTIRKDE